MSFCLLIGDLSPAVLTFRFYCILCIYFIIHFSFSCMRISHQRCNEKSTHDWSGLGDNLIVDIVVGITVE
jgi:hypothetical protein